MSFLFASNDTCDALKTLTSLAIENAILHPDLMTMSQVICNFWIDVVVEDGSYDGSIARGKGI